MGSPSSVQCSGRLTAGWPLTLYTAVNGANRFIRSKVCSGSSPSSNQPIGTGGWVRVGVSTAS